MCLGHVYIVLEPVGSARLKFCDDRYYEFLCFDVPKVVRSPIYDHGHDEESQNGRDIKIDILDHVIQTPEVFRMVSDKTGVPEGLPEPPRGTNGPPWALLERGGQPGQATPPLMGSPNRTRRGARPPFPSPSPSFSFPLPIPSWTRKGESYSH